MVIYSANQIGIIFPGERSELVGRASAKLSELGYLENPSDIATPDVISALNKWRGDNSLPALDYFDPVSLRLLGFDVGGDEIIFLARRAEVFLTDVERYDFCKNALETAKISGATPIGSLSSDLSELPQASVNSLKCALIAYLIGRGG